MAKFFVLLRQEQYEEMEVEAETDKQAKRKAEAKQREVTGIDDWYAVLAKEYA